MQLHYTTTEAEKLRSKLPKMNASEWDSEAKDFKTVPLDWDEYAFISDEGVLRLSAEGEHSQLCIADYWGEFRGGFPWINPALEEWADDLGLHFEWESPGCIGLYE